MIKCQVCGYENVEGDDYCEECGVKLEEVSEGKDEKEESKPSADAAVSSASTEGTECSNCGAALAADDAFCPDCGKSFKDGENLDKAMQLPDPVEEGSSDSSSLLVLRVVAGKEKDKLYEVSKNELRIGRHAENDIVLDADGYVSGSHSRIFRQDGEVFIEDLGSTNGTFIKIKKLTRLTPGDEVKIGQSIFRFED